MFIKITVIVQHVHLDIPDALATLVTDLFLVCLEVVVLSPMFLPRLVAVENFFTHTADVFPDVVVFLFDMFHMVIPGMQFLRHIIVILIYIMLMINPNFELKQTKNKYVFFPRNYLEYIFFSVVFFTSLH